MIIVPDNIRNSKWFTAEQLQLLANVSSVPAVDPAFDDERMKNIFQYYSLIPEEMETEIHRYASELLFEGKVDDAWQVLLSADVL